MEQPANSAKPLLLVDVDGVISLFGFDGRDPPEGRFTNVDGMVHYLSATAGGHLIRLAEHFELVWCTGWQERANEHLLATLGLPEPLPDVVLEGPPEAARRQWKLDGIEAYAGPDRPLAWIDDDNAGCEDWARERPGPTLLVTADPQVGITAAHVERLVDWARGVA
jgi:hypothetical protein